MNLWLSKEEEQRELEGDRFTKGEHNLNEGVKEYKFDDHQDSTSKRLSREVVEVVHVKEDNRVWEIS